MLPATQAVFEFMLVRPLLAGDGGQVHLSWRAADQGGRVVQVYVDGLLTAVSGDPGQRAIWLTLDRRRPRRVELLAVDPEEALRSRRDALRAWSPPLDAEVHPTLPRDPRLPPDSRVVLSVDGREVRAIPLWSGDDARGGLGGVLGGGALGHDNAAAPGLGRGPLGVGPLGEDDFPWRGRVAGLSPGGHLVAAVVRDAAGRVRAGPWQRAVQVDTPPPPPGGLAIAPDFTVTWT